VKVYCAPRDSWDAPKKADLKLLLFDVPDKKSEGSIGHSLLQTIERLQLVPAQRAWDLLSIALGVVAADHGCLRRTSPDGWTREIELSVAVSDPKFWGGQAPALESALCFLTGDIWKVSFTEGGISPKPPKHAKPRDESVACLLSGGMDSLVGAIDIAAAQGEMPLLVSQVSKGDKTNQTYFARQICGDEHHLQLNHDVYTPGEAETSQRARSLIFLAYGVLAATALKSYKASGKTTLIVPENGFISLNVPLTPMRIGSLSTRTTHPAFITRVQGLLAAAGLSVTLLNPYQFKTKGQMLVQCKNNTLLEKLIGSTMSCGRSARINMHCGRCVPCLIRRAAFHRWNGADPTHYKYKDLSRRGSDHSAFDDVRAAAMAVEYVRRNGIERWSAGALNSAQLGDVSKYQDMAKRGLAELAAFLAAAKVK
jgi:7-cyano-7-deazaguanine synthase in queuosine biosynthesis